MSGISKARTLFQGGLNGWMQRFMAKRLEAAGKCIISVATEFSVDYFEMI